MILLLSVLLNALTVLSWIILVWVILGWVLMFGARSSFAWRNRGVFDFLLRLNALLSRFIHPLLRPFRKLLKPIRVGDGAYVDLSPLLLYLAIILAQKLIVIAGSAILSR